MRVPKRRRGFSAKSSTPDFRALSSVLIRWWRVFDEVHLSPAFDLKPSVKLCRTCWTPWMTNREGELERNFLAAIVLMVSIGAGCFYLLVFLQIPMPGNRAVGSIALFQSRSVYENKSSHP
jgi:hypothetical protein